MPEKVPINFMNVEKQFKDLYEIEKQYDWYIKAIKLTDDKFQNKPKKKKKKRKKKEWQKNKIKRLKAMGKVRA